ncbi:MAG TPA: glutathione S-transferase family protein [Myxococcota bacterium]|nr:glutathione S-transferase family protein [Myxococcota bacterium]
MRLYGATPSPFFRKVRVVLEEKGIPYEIERLAPVPKTPELLALHPMGKIPILRDGAVVVPDSSVICAYLEKKVPSPQLYPDDPAEFARALFLEEYADTKLGEVMGGIFFERFVKPNILQQPTDEARVKEKLENELPGVMDYLETQVPSDGDSVLARFGIADAALGAHLGNLTFAGLEIDARRWPRTARYYHALLARPSFKTATAM